MAMFCPPTHPRIGIELLCPGQKPREDLQRLSEQISYFMVGVQRFYIDELGCERIDTDPPPGSLEDIRQCPERLQRAGALSGTGFSVITAHRLGKDGQPSQLVDGLVGLLILSKPQGICLGRQHTSAEIVEFDVAEKQRGTKLGRALLYYGMQQVHPEDEVVLDVAAQNAHAIKVYEHYGFVFTNEPPMFHDVFNVPYRAMHVAAITLRQAVDLDMPPQAVDR